MSKRKTFVDVPHDVSSVGVVCCGWFNQVLLARDAISRDPNILSVKYEDILSRSRMTLRYIFECVSIAEIHLDKALESLERDSQFGVSFSRDKSRDKSALHTSVLDKVKCDVILSKYS